VKARRGIIYRLYRVYRTIALPSYISHTFALPFAILRSIDLRYIPT